tara:strand:- start:3016 stop:3570 length:555 start_codon:yes stop_codon:yes gene_type:complete
MDSLPPRSEEALKKQYDKNRKGRTEHSTLREQVVYPKPQEMWPTPRSSAAMAEKTETVKKRVDKRGFLGAKLEERVAMWPTPRATKRSANYEQPSPSMINGTHGWSLPAAVTDSHSEKPNKMWPTPRSAIGMHMKLTENMEKLHHKKYLETEVAYTDKPRGGHLNPMWVEWLMGYPIGWTDLKD